MIGEPLGCLLRLIWLPYQIWQAMSGDSLMGTSELDRHAGRLWKSFAVIGTILLLAGVVAWISLALK